MSENQSLDGKYEEEKVEYLVCDACKYPIASASELIEERFISWKKVVFSYNLTVLDRDCWCYSADNPNQCRFDVIRVLPSVVNDSKTINIRGVPTPEFSWFPGYSWQMASCLACGSHLGWAFSVDNSEKLEKKSKTTTQNTSDEYATQDKKSSIIRPTQILPITSTTDSIDIINSNSLSTIDFNVSPSNITESSTQISPNITESESSLISSSENITGSSSDTQLSENITESESSLIPSSENITELSEDITESDSSLISSSENSTESSNDTQLSENIQIEIQNQDLEISDSESDIITIEDKNKYQKDVCFVGLILTRLCSRTLTSSKIDKMNSLRESVVNHYPLYRRHMTEIISTLNNLPLAIAGHFYPQISEMQSDPSLQLESSRLLESVRALDIQLQEQQRNSQSSNTQTENTNTDQQTTSHSDTNTISSETNPVQLDINNLVNQNLIRIGDIATHSNVSNAAIRRHLIALRSRQVALRSRQVFLRLMSRINQEDILTHSHNDSHDENTHDSHDENTHDSHDENTHDSHDENTHDSHDDNEDTSPNNSEDILDFTLDDMNDSSQDEEESF